MMANVYEVLEITCDGKPTGKYRMTRKSDESSSSPITGICDHEHDTKEQARSCPVVVEKMAKIFPPRIRADALVARVGELEKALSDERLVTTSYNSTVKTLKKRIAELQDRLTESEKQFAIAINGQGEMGREVTKQMTRAETAEADLGKLRDCAAGKPAGNYTRCGRCVSCLSSDAKQIGKGRDAAIQQVKRLQAIVQKAHVENPHLDADYRKRLLESIGEQSDKAST